MTLDDAPDCACDICNLWPAPGEDQSAYRVRLREQFGRVPIPLTPAEIARRARETRRQGE